MVTDSSSGTLPSSSRLTIVSSSSIARSKGSRVTSEWGSSAMVIPVRPRCSRTLYIWARVGVGKAAHPQLFRVGKTVHAPCPGGSATSDGFAHPTAPRFSGSPLHQGGDVDGNGVGEGRKVV